MTAGRYCNREVIITAPETAQLIAEISNDLVKLIRREQLHEQQEWP